jgi:hypothetical protein
MPILLSTSEIDKERETWEGVLKASFCGRIWQVASTGHSPSRALPLLRFLRGMTVTPLQVCCDGHGLAPLETEVQPIQASPCVQDLRNGMYIPSMTSAF